MFSWKIRERINSLIEGMEKEKSSQNLSNKEKTAKQFDQDKKWQNKYFNKNMGAVDADKVMLFLNA